MDKEKEMLHTVMLIMVAYLLGILSAFVGIGFIMQTRVQEALTVPESHIVQ